MPNYPYTFQLPPLNVQDIPNDGVAGEFLGINGSGVLDWLTAGGGGTGDMLKADNLSGLTSYPTARTNLGLGTGDSPQFKNLVISAGTLTSDAPVTISQTWNGTGSTVFKALVVNATTPGTTSSTSSLLLDLQVGGVSQLSITKGGSIISKVGVIGSNGVPNAAGLSLELFYASYGLGIDGNGNTVFFRNGLAKSRSGLGVATSSDQSIGWTNTTHVGLDALLDTILLRDGAANTLALRNGDVGQTFNIYGTYTGAGVNYARLGIYCAQNGNTTIATQANGTGVAGAFIFSPSNTERMRITTAGNVGIGTTSPTSKLHVAGSSSPSITVDNTVNTGASQLLFKNTVVTGDTDGIFLNGSTQTGFGGNGSLNIKATTGPIAFHTASVTNALSIAQNGAITANGEVITSTLGNFQWLHRSPDSDTGIKYNGSRTLTISDTIAVSAASVGARVWMRSDVLFQWSSGTNIGSPTPNVGLSRNGDGVLEVNSGTAGTFRDLRVRSVIQQLPITTTITPASNGDLVVEATSNTTLTFKLKGTDGTVRSGTITLA